MHFCFRNGMRCVIPGHKTIDTNTGLLLSHYQPKVWEKRKKKICHLQCISSCPLGTSGLPTKALSLNTLRLLPCTTVWKLRNLLFPPVYIMWRLKSGSMVLWIPQSHHSWKCTRVVIGSQKTINLGYFAINPKEQQAAVILAKLTVSAYLTVQGASVERRSINFQDPGQWLSENFGAVCNHCL